MKLSYNWLSEHFSQSLPSAEALGEKLTLHTCELEEVIEQSSYFKNVHAGKLLSFEAHSDSEKLSVAQFDLGALGTKQIVFGQVHKVVVGEIYPIAIAGAVLQSGTEIKESEIRGVASQGMICDNNDLGMKNGELLRFSADTELGTSLVDICSEFGDSLLDIDNKSLTHRPDLMGHAGFVREVKVIENQEGVWKEPLPLFENPTVKVNVQTDVCRRFCAVAMNDIEVMQAPLEMMVRLENLGVRSISNFVDITNWIMLGYGQPMHVFDADKIEGNIIVRQAKQGETLLALDGEEYELDENDTVVADEKKVLSIGGIMGGLESGVTNETTNVVFECASWDPVAIRKTSTRLGLRSDSSMRYEKSLDPENCPHAIAMALEIAEKFCPNANIIGGCTDQYPTKWKQTEVVVTTDYLREYNGIDISDADIERILTGLGFEISKQGNVLTLQIPSWRATKDVSIKQDIAEEIVRMYGFHNVPSEKPALSIRPVEVNLLRELEWQMRDFWSHASYLEVKHYAYVPHSDPFFDPKVAVEIANPLSDQTAVMRQTLLSRMLLDLESEVRTHGELRIFEIGKVYTTSDDVLPSEVLTLGVCRSELDATDDQVWANVKQDLEQYVSQYRLPLEFSPLQDAKAWTHPGKSAQIQTIDGVVIGHITVVHPSYAPLKKAPTVYAELNLETLLEVQLKREWTYKPISFYPIVHRDISFVVDDRVLIGDLEKSFQEASSLIQSVKLFDEFYHDEKVGIGKKNLAFHLSFQSNDGTLGEEQIDPIMKKVVQTIEQDFAGVMREA